MIKKKKKQSYKSRTPICGRKRCGEWERVSSKSREDRCVHLSLRLWLTNFGSKTALGHAAVAESSWPFGLRATTALPRFRAGFQPLLSFPLIELGSRKKKRGGSRRPWYWTEATEGSRDFRLRLSVHGPPITAAASILILHTYPPPYGHTTRTHENTRQITRLITVIS